MEFTLPALPYKLDDLHPFLSEEAMIYHFHKHHRNYVEKLNTLIKNTPFEEVDLEETVKASSGELFQNAAQAWNHTFFWLGLSPQTRFERPMNLEVGHQIVRDFGSLENFERHFLHEGEKIFGSGWVWLVRGENGDQVSLFTTKDGDTPLTRGLCPLLTCDVWEHAYYVDYRHGRRDFLEQFLKAIDWNFVDDNFQREHPRHLTDLMREGSDRAPHLSP